MNVFYTGEKQPVQMHTDYSTIVLIVKRQNLSFVPPLRLVFFTNRLSGAGLTFTANHPHYRRAARNAEVYLRAARAHSRPALAGGFHWCLHK